MAYGFNDDKSKAPVYTQEEADARFQQQGSGTFTIDDIVVNDDLSVGDAITAGGEVTATDANEVQHNLTEKLDKNDYRDGLTWDELEDSYTWNELAGRGLVDQTTQTTNLNMTKQGGDAHVSNDLINANWDIIDTTLGAIDVTNDGDVQTQLANIELYLESLVKPIIGADPAISHRNLFRGKYLGNTVTQDQWDAIEAGTFDDLWVGDYWTIPVTINGNTVNVNWRIADIDYWLHAGDTEFTQHHLVIVPDYSLYDSNMNNSNTTTGGYIGSAMYTSNLALAKTAINSAFGSLHVLTHREHLTNAVTNGYPSGGGWVDSEVELMSESQVYGHPHFAPAVTWASGSNTTIPNNYTIDYLQFALFQQAPEFVRTRETYWLRDVVSATSFVRVHYYGLAHIDGASASYGVRPAFAIGQISS